MNAKAYIDMVVSVNPHFLIGIAGWQIATEQYTVAATYVHVIKHYETSIPRVASANDMQAIDAYTATLSAKQKKLLELLYFGDFDDVLKELENNG